MTRALEAADEERLTALVGRAARQRERMLAAESLVGRASCSASW